MKWGSPPSANNLSRNAYVRVPRLRNGVFSTESFARYQRSEQALLLAFVESEASWSAFFSWFKSQISRRGHGRLRQPQWFVKDLKAQLQGTTWQRCQTQFMRNFLDGTIVNESCEVVTNYGDKAPKAILVLEKGLNDIAAALTLPERVNL